MANNATLKAGGSYTVTGQSSTERPSLAVFEKLLFEAHRANSSSNDDKLYCSCLGEDDDPNKWKSHNPNSKWKTSAAPSLTVFNEGLCMAWKAGGSTKDVYYAYMNPKKEWGDSVKIKPVSGTVQTTISPTLSVFPKTAKELRMYLFYVGYPDKKGVGIICWTKLAKDGGKDYKWAAPLTSGDPMRTKFPPSVAVLNNKQYIAFLDDNNKVKVATMHRDENMDVGYVSPADAQSDGPPSIFTFNGGLYLVWNSTDKGYTLSSRLEDDKWGEPQPIFSGADGKAVKGKNGVPVFNERFRTGVYGVWKDKKDGNKLKFSNFSGMKIDHVVLLMLENRSFDHMLGYSKISGLEKLKGTESNTFKGVKYQVSDTAPFKMMSDPGHEFEDAYEQLCGEGKKFNRGPKYPAGSDSINNSGFVASFSKTTQNAGNYGDTMKCYNPDNLPVLNQLAEEFAVCDHWFSSLPGPTAPNRFFSLAATSGGLDNSPEGLTIPGWMGITDALEAAAAAGSAVVNPLATPFLVTAWAAKKMVQLFKNGDMYNGLRFKNGSIFGRIKHPKSKIFVDHNGKEMGELPMALCLAEVRWTHFHDLKKFKDEIKDKNYKPAFTLIEPNYGNPGGDFSGGTSQHPVDDVSKGEGLIKEVYEAIRNSPNWENTVLIVTYDEHGGFYDHVAPPAAVPPGDGNYNGLNKNGFNFDRLGCRVPAVVISPWIKKGTVDKTVYDHASVAATLTSIFGMKPLTDRDRSANNITPLLNLQTTRTDCPTQLKNVVSEKAQSKSKAPKASVAANKKAGKVIDDDGPLPASGNVMVFLFSALKLHAQLGNEPEEKLALRFSRIRTKKQAGKFIKEAVVMLKARRAEME